MKTLSNIMLTAIVAGTAAMGWTSAGAWWNNDRDDYYYDRPWYGGPWYGRYPGYGWGGYPGYGWGGYPGYYGGSPVIRIITAPVAPDSDEGDSSIVH